MSTAEYSSLRSEIGTYSTQIASMMYWTTATTIALLSLAAGWQHHYSWAIALFPFLVILPCAVHHLSARRNILRLASYLRAFASAEHQYETRLRELRLRTRLAPQENREDCLRGEDLQLEVLNSQMESPPALIWLDFTTATAAAFCASTILSGTTSTWLLWTTPEGPPTATRALISTAIYLLAACVCGQISWYSIQLKPGGKLDRAYEDAWKQTAPPTAGHTHSS